MAEEPPVTNTSQTGFLRRLTDRNQWPRRWWWPDAPGATLDSPEEILRRHDEASKTIRRVMLTLVAYGFFCLFTLSQPDLVVITGTFELPFAKVPVAFEAFLVVGPLVLIGFTIYLHIFIGYWNRLPLEEEYKALPFVFNMEGRVPRLLSGFLFYWLSPVVLWYFTYKAGKHPFAEPLLLLTVLTAAALFTLQIKRTPPARRGNWSYRVVWLVLVFFGALSLFQAMQQGVGLTQMAYRSTVNMVKPIVVASLPNLPGLGSRGEPTPPPAGNGAPGGSATLPSVAPPPATPSPAPSVRPTPATPLPPVAASRRPARPPPNVQQKVPTAQNTANIAQSVLGLGRGLNLAGADLRGVDLFKRDLRGANLSGANLQGEDLASINFSNADLSRANLKDAGLIAADLSGVNFSGAGLRGAILRGANLSKANFDGADLTKADFRGVKNMTCAQFRTNFSWEDAYRDPEFACGGRIPVPPKVK